MNTTLWLRDLSRRIGEPPERLAWWMEQGLLDDIPERHDSTPTAGEIERVRLLQGLLLQGLPEPDAIQAVRDHGRTVDRYVDRWLDTRERTHSVDEAARRHGVDAKLAAELLASAGLASNDRLTDADLDAINRLQVALDAGLTPDAMTQLLRVYGDAVQRIAEAEIRLFQVHVYERLRASGLDDDELNDRSQSAGGTLRSLVEPTLLYFHRRAWAAAMRENLAMHVASEVGRPAIDDAGRMPSAVVFIDLCGFTSLTATMGDAVAAEVIDRFAGIVRRAVQNSPGHVVKQIGDEFMLIFPDAAAAVRCALDVERGVTGQARFPSCRAGVHWGSILYRDGDYVGTNVNLAHRLAAEAEPHQILVTGTVVHEAGQAGSDLSFTSLGPRQLRGIPDTVPVYTATPESP